jgi:hypothetical protein
MGKILMNNFETNTADDVLVFRDSKFSCGNQRYL